MTENNHHGLEVVHVSRDDEEAEIIVGFLQSNGIEAIIDSNLTHSVLPVEDDARILVNEDDAERARQLIAEREAPGAKSLVDENSEV